MARGRSTARSSRSKRSMGRSPVVACRRTLAVPSSQRLQREAQSENFWVVTNGKFTVATNTVELDLGL